MNDGLIPNRYAKALFKLSQERGDTALVYDEMKRLDCAYVTEAGLKKAVNNPFLPLEDKLRLLCVAAGIEEGSYEEGRGRGTGAASNVCAKSLQSCLTLCNSMYCSSPGSSVHGIFQARILEWVAISFSRVLF